jgi:peptidoglycan/xylan/chitin deacetylase (PgdA/CDA1 family)
MVRKLELCIDALLYITGLIRLARWWNRHAGKRLVVLCYHRMEGGYLREHLRYLRRHYRILHLEAALEELYAPSKGIEQGRDRRTLLALTFDDGYRDHYTYGFRLVRQLQVPITIFLIPGYIENRQRFWWGEAEYLLSHTSVREATIEGKTYHLENPDDRHALLDLIEQRVRYAQSVAEREVFIGRLYEILALPRHTQVEDDVQRSLTWEEVQEMQRCEWISFGVHTMYHPILSCLKDPSELLYEVAHSRLAIEQELQCSVRTFAYPVGKKEHIGTQAIYAVQKAGYTWALTTIHGINTPKTDPLQVHRIVVDVEQPWLLIAAKASGLWDVLTTLGRPRAFFRKCLLFIGRER